MPSAKRPDKGLLAGLWQFPNTPGKLDAQAALKWVEENSLKPNEILIQVERKHIFTHIEWDMCGVYINVSGCGSNFVWMSEDEIRGQAALPTAFRLFLPEENLNFFIKK